MVRKNVYAGKDSTAKIPVSGKVDTFKEIIAIAYALSYDLKDKVLLTRSRKIVKATPQRVNGRFKVLYLLANEHSKKAKSVITKFHQLANQFLSGRINVYQYISSIRAIAMQHLHPNEVFDIEMRVRMAEGWKFV